MYLSGLDYRGDVSLLLEHGEDFLPLSVDDDIGQTVLNVDGRAVFMVEMEGDVMSLSCQGNCTVMSGKALPKFIDE